MQKVTSTPNCTSSLVKAAQGAAKVFVVAIVASAVASTIFFLIAAAVNSPLNAPGFLGDLAKHINDLSDVTKAGTAAILAFGTACAVIQAAASLFPKKESVEVQIPDEFSEAAQNPELIFSEEFLQGYAEKLGKRSHMTSDGDDGDLIPEVKQYLSQFKIYLATARQTPAGGFPKVRATDSYMISEYGPKRGWSQSTKESHQRSLKTAEELRPVTMYQDASYDLKRSTRIDVLLDMVKVPSTS
jgi:hypothetical protein